MSRSLVLLVIAVVANEAQGSGGAVKTMMGLGMDLFGVTDSINQFEKVVEESHKELVGSVGSASKAFSSKFNEITDQVDDHTLEELFGQLFPDVPRDSGNNTCLEGLKAKKKEVGSICMENGHLTYMEPLQLKPVIKRKIGDYVLVEVQVIFSDIWLSYSWTYISTALFGWNRLGKMKLQQSGPNMVAVVATIPATRSIIELLIKKTKCFVKVQKLEFRLGDKFSADKIHYESVAKDTIGVGFTEGYVREVVLSARLDIQDRLKERLKELITPATNKPNVFCDNDVTKPEEIDCKNIFDATIFHNTN